MPEREKFPIEEQVSGIEPCAARSGSIIQGESTEVVQETNKHGTNDVTGALTESLVSPNFSPS